MSKRLAWGGFLVVALYVLYGGIAEPATEPNAYGTERRMQGWSKLENGLGHSGSRTAASTDPSEILGLVANIPLGSTTVSPDAADVQAAIAHAGPPYYSVGCYAESSYYRLGGPTVGCSAQSALWLLYYEEHIEFGVTQSARSSVTFSIPPAPPGQVVRHAELELLLPTKQSGGQIVPWTGSAGSGSSLALNGRAYTLKDIEYGSANACGSGPTSPVARVAWDFTAEVAGLAAGGGGLLELTPDAPPSEPDPVGGQTARACATWSSGRVLRITFGPRLPDNRARETAQGPQDCLNLVGNPINVTTGNMYTQQEDLAYPSAFGRFAFTRTYNSQSTYAGPLGLGWTRPYDFEVKELQPGVIRLRNGAGNVRFYELVSGSTATYRPAAPARDTSMLVKHAEGFIETERSGLRREFDLTGRVLAIINRAGWQVSFMYTDGFLTAVTDPGGQTLSFSYADGKLTRIEGPGGLFTTYSYDAQGQLTAVADALGTRWTYSYSDTSPSRLATVRDANGNAVEAHTYDEEGRVILTRGAGGLQARTLEYVGGSTTRVTDSLGRVTTYTFGIFGNQPLITQIEGPCPCGGPDSTFEYDTQGRRVRQNDARGNRTTFQYDADGNPTQVTDALGQVTVSTYNAFGQVLTTTDTTMATTTLAYDGATGFLLQVTNALGHLTTFTPESHTLPGTLTDPRGDPTTFTYSDTGLLTALTDPTGVTTHFTYDAVGRLLQMTDAQGGASRYTYDARGRVLSLTDPIRAVTQFAYDPAGNQTRLTDPNGRQTIYIYDTANRLIQVTDPASRPTAYTYDTESNLLSVTDAKGQTTAFAYDDHNRLMTRTDPLGKAETFAYDAAGNLVSRTDRKGQTITYAYDGLNRLTQKTLPDGATVTYTYDPLGRLLSATDLNGPLAFTYDLLGRVQSTTSQDSRTLNFTYDPAGNRIGLRDETGHVTSYTYDPKNLLTTLTDPRIGTFNFKYDRLGRRTALTRPNGIGTSYTYDPASRLTGLSHGGRWGPFEALNYTYDPASNRLTDTRNHLRHQYAYDPLDQLTRVQEQDHRHYGKVSEAYTYDPVGNRLTGPERESYAYDWANRLTQDATGAYASDANGNLIEKRSLKHGRVSTYTYDAEDRLIRVVTPHAEISFQYDPLGRRTEKRVVRWHDEDGDQEPDEDEERPPRVSRYLYDREDILATLNDAGRELARYTHGPGIDEPLAEVRHHRTRFYHADVLGSVVALTDKHGDSIRHYRYSVFGVPEDHRGDSQPYRFTGREWDKEIDLYYYRARYYVPRLGRFLAPDPIGFSGGQLNLYTYAANNPAKFVDPDGLSQVLIIIERSSITQKSTIGTLTVNYKSIGYTLELPDRANQRWISRIPAGTYFGELYDSPEKGRTVRLRNVPDRSDILIHAGNYPEDTQGCILPGKTAGNGVVGDSRKALAEILRIIDMARTADKAIGEPTEIIIGVR